MSEIIVDWDQLEFKECILENKKSSLKVSFATNFGDYNFYTSGESILKHHQSIINGANIYLATGGNANVKFEDGAAAYSTDTYSLKTKDNVDTKYLYYYLLSNLQYINDNFFQGSGLKHLQKKDLKQFLVKIPKDIREQKKIAEILSKVDGAIDNTEKLIQKYEQVKVGLMQDLLTKGIDENGNIRSEETHQFKDSSLDIIPMEWDYSNFKLLCKFDITYGIVQAGPNIENGVAYIKTGDLTGDNFKINNLQRTSVEIAKRFKRSTMELGEIVFALRGDIGNSKIITEEFVGANLTQGTARISFDENKVLNKFAIYMFQMPLIKKQIEEAQKGTTFQEISLSSLRSFELFYPNNIREQKVIVKHLDKITDKIIGEIKILNKLKLQKQGLMQDLLLGKVRVNY
ncbi:restriction endonuclease subunit S [Chryseobacterium sp. JK1]|uniref:restriction endonuclease subunit S n=1 Tax=Chryseobacterium sp. JK1 TaxID=874294 RepID=UPI003D699C38